MDEMKELKKRIKPGVYRHFKGKLYEVTGLAYHSEDMSVMVVYRALYGEGALFVRDARMWEECVEHNGKTVKRFEYLNDKDGETKESTPKA